MTTEQRAAWSTAFINTLPDASFLYIEPGGTKDQSGRTTPRSLRHFPVKDGSGKVDVPHLLNAMAQIPKANLSQAIKDRMAAAAQKMHDAMNREAPQDQTEIRSTALWPDVELRTTQDGFSFDGYAAVFDTPSVRMAFPGINSGRPFREVIHRGAFAKTLAEAPVIRLLWQHDDRALPLASTRNGSMSLQEDGRGLRVTGTLPDDEWGRPVRNAIADGRIAGMSFRFQKVLDKFTKDNGEDTRHLQEVRLVQEVSITDNPAYPATTASVRSADDEPFVVLTEEELKAVHRAAMPMASNACCDSCGTNDCCQGPGSPDCPSDCTGCDQCDCGDAAEDANDPADVGEMDSAPAEEAEAAMAAIAERQAQRRKRIAANTQA